MGDRIKPMKAAIIALLPHFSNNGMNGFLKNVFGKVNNVMNFWIIIFSDVVLNITLPLHSKICEISGSLKVKT